MRCVRVGAYGELSQPNEESELKLSVLSSSLTQTFKSLWNIMENRLNQHMALDMRMSKTCMVLCGPYSGFFFFLVFFLPSSALFRFRGEPLVALREIIISFRNGELEFPNEIIYNYSKSNESGTSIVKEREPSRSMIIQ